MAVRTATNVLLVEDKPADLNRIQHAMTDSDPELRLGMKREDPEALSFLRKALLLTHVPPPGLMSLDLRFLTRNATERRRLRPGGQRSALCERTLPRGAQWSGSRRPRCSCRQKS
jgi:hypothetical protein